MQGFLGNSSGRKRRENDSLFSGGGEYVFHKIYIKYLIFLYFFFTMEKLKHT